MTVNMQKLQKKEYLHSVNHILDAHGIAESDKATIFLDILPSTSFHFVSVRLYMF